tara:strand:+ start:59118 stop:59654 length:537 start_codon:yes stop_codon:yes gene_type:complete
MKRWVPVLLALVLLVGAPALAAPELQLSAVDSLWSGEMLGFRLAQPDGRAARRRSIEVDCFSTGGRVSATAQMPQARVCERGDHAFLATFDEEGRLHTFRSTARTRSLVLYNQVTLSTLGDIGPSTVNQGSTRIWATRTVSGERWTIVYHQGDEHLFTFHTRDYVREDQLQELEIRTE